MTQIREKKLQVDANKMIRIGVYVLCLCPMFYVLPTDTIMYLKCTFCI